ncbi:unnamed protein product [Acanthoscelides obtectus]|uniref:Uncharacterized protein n=1 Tax=Acanthoscelides obtectus TaxID=200917 RepID=A0A9P0P9P6_ACAOB|nr:unnamed protein product [Acanthoscelides obtectus]CAK1679965.1 hypothetical protein AOBTE_LOCUS32477 [Acanthoscelides obtectus]
MWQIIKPKKRKAVAKMSKANNNSVKYYTRQVIRVVYGIVELMFHKLFGLIYGKGQCMPPITDLILLDSATTLAFKIRTRKLRANQTLRTQIIWDAMTKTRNEKCIK